MSILIFANELNGVNGLVKSTINTANLLSQADNDVKIIMCCDETIKGSFKEFENIFKLNNNIEVYSIKSLAVEGGKFLYKKFITSFAEKQQFLKAEFSEHDMLVLQKINSIIDEKDLVIFTHPLQAALYSLATKNDLRKVKTIMQIHGNYDEEIDNKRLFLKGLNSIDIVQIVSESMRPIIKNITGLENDRITYIPNVHFPKDIKKEKSNNFNVSIIGSLQNRKNQIDAVKAIEMIDNKNIHLNIWGKQSNEYGEFINSYINNCGLNKRITLHGVKDEESIYSKTDLIIITSKHEGFGYTMIEGATHSIPTIAYDYKFGADEFIKSGTNGTIIPIYDYVALARQIERYFQNPLELKSHGEAAFDTFQKKFSPEKILQKFNFYVPLKFNRKADEFYKNFSRNGSQPIPFIDSIRKKTLRFLGTPIIDVITYKQHENIKSYKLFILDSNGKLSRIFHKVNQGKVIAIVRRIKRQIRGARNAYIVLAQFSNDSYSYISSMSSNSKRICYNKRFSVEAQENSHEINKIASEKIIISDGKTFIPYLDFEGIKKIVDEEGNSLSFKIIAKTTKKVSSNFLNIDNTFESFKVSYHSGKSTSFEAPNVSYKEVFERILYLEEEYDLLNYSVNGVFLWEMLRAPLLESLMMTYGKWGIHKFAVGAKPEYFGKKKIMEAPDSEKLIFELPRKKDIDHITTPFVSKDSIIIEYPQKYGYTSGSYTNGPVYPIDQFKKMVDGYEDKYEGIKLLKKEKYKSGFLEEIIKKEFKISVDLTSESNRRLLKFKKEFWFWSQYFEKRSVKEVLIPSAYWSPGICHAAHEFGITSSDIQYALVSNLHPINNFSGRTSYTPKRFYAWSRYWAEEIKKYDEVKIFPRSLPSITKSTKSEELFDLCLLSQPRVAKRLKKYLLEIADYYPQKRIAYCLHPDDSIKHSLEDSEINSRKNIIVRYGTSFQDINNSEITLGGYSTSMYEASFLGKPVYVLPVPGWEMLERAINEGIMRLYESLENIVPFKPSPKSNQLF